jgi:DNA-binding transcriptional ArsR family regulator
MTATTDDDLWSAIADPSRRRLLDILVQQGAASASALAKEVPFTRQAVIKHLSVLEEARLVSRHRAGREVLFRIEPGRLDEATRALAAVASAWDVRLRAIKRLAETAHRERPTRNA